MIFNFAKGEAREIDYKSAPTILSGAVDCKWSLSTQGSGDWYYQPKPSLGFRAEKRFAQASTHPLSQAQGGLLTVFDCLFVCH